MKQPLERLIDWLDHRRGRNEAAAVASPYRNGVRTVTDSPLPRSSRGLLAVLIALLVAVLAWATLGRIDVTGTAQGTTIVDSRVKPIQAPARGMVREVLVEEGDRVRRDELLVRLDSTSAAAEVRDLRSKLARARAARARLEALLATDRATDFAVSGDPVTPGLDAPDAIPRATVEQARALMRSQWRAYRDQVLELQRQRANHQARLETTRASVESIEAELPYLEGRVERLETLNGSESVARQKLDDARSKLVKRRHALEVEQRRLAEARAELALMDQRIAAAQSQFREEKAGELAETESTLAATKEQLAQARSKLDKHAIRSPIDGVVQDVSVHSRRAVVRPADTLMRVVPEERNVEVAARILNKDIGFAHEGQRVDVKLQAYDFTRYGAVPGVIREIASTSTEDKKLGRVYRARVELERPFIAVDGRKVRLRPGLTATVDIDMGSRRIIEYFLEPLLRYRDQALSER